MARLLDVIQGFLFISSFYYLDSQENPLQICTVTLNTNVPRQKLLSVLFSSLHISSVFEFKNPNGKDVGIRYWLMSLQLQNLHISQIRLQIVSQHINLASGHPSNVTHNPSSMVILTRFPTPKITTFYVRWFCTKYLSHH